MKQLLFLLLFPCLALAQYQGNANQKITLGEQTTADGLVFRGVAEIDTVTATSKITRANKQDTSAYLLLDTVTNLLWHYKIGSNAWTQAGGGVSVSSFSAGTTGLTPSTATTGAVTLGGTLAVSNGGTNTSTLTANKVMVGNGTSAVLTPTNLHWDNTQSRLGIGTASPGYPIHIYSSGSTPAILRISNVGSSYTSYAEFALETNTGFAAFFKQSSANSTYGGAGSLNFGTVPNENVAIFTDNTIRLLIEGGGSVGVGTLTPQAGYRMHIVDSLYVGGRVSAAGYTTRSDYNLKDEIQTLNYGLNEVIQMQPVKYTYKSNGEQQLGFIAQDIGTLIPESVHFDEFMGVDYQSLIPILTKAIQEQQALIKALEQRILNLENK